MTMLLIAGTTLRRAGGIAVRVEAIGQTKARHADLLAALSTVELAVLLTTLADPANRQRMVYDFDRRLRLHAKPAPRLPAQAVDLAETNITLKRRAERLAAARRR